MLDGKGWLGGGVLGGRGEWSLVTMLMEGVIVVNMMGWMIIVVWVIVLVVGFGEGGICF